MPTNNHINRGFTIAMASDHAGIELRQFLGQRLQDRGHEIKDLGPFVADSVDYPDYAAKACHAVIDGSCQRAVLVCGTGIGMSIAANKIPGIRAAHVESIFTARMSAEHNSANVLCLGERVTGTTNAAMMVRAWLNAKFESRHQKRLDKINDLPYDGRPLREHSYYVMGQLCVAKPYRGRSVVEMMYGLHRDLYSSRFDMMVLTISTENTRSVRVHERIGFTDIHVYNDHFGAWKVCVWDWRGR